MRLLLALAVALTLVGCGGHPIEKKLEGRWVGDGVENFDDTRMAVATGWAKGASFEFSGTSLTVAIPAEEPRTGTYKVVSVRENDVDIAVTRQDGAVDKARFRLDSEHSIRWMLGDERSVVLRRQ
jgi:hypothetical protein